MSDPRPGWDAYFLKIAEDVAARADCTRRRVGAVIVSPDHRIIATGYNGAPPGAPGCLTAGACPRGRLTYGELGHQEGGYDNCIAHHAERNAREFARESCQGATIYITCGPCQDCHQMLKDAGIVRVVYPAGIMEYTP